MCSNIYFDFILREAEWDEICKRLSCLQVFHLHFEEWDQVICGESTIIDHLQDKRGIWIASSKTTSVFCGGASGVFGEQETKTKMTEIKQIGKPFHHTSLPTPSMQDAYDYQSHLQMMQSNAFPINKHSKPIWKTISAQLNHDLSIHPRTISNDSMLKSMPIAIVQHPSVRKAPLREHVSAFPAKHHPAPKR